MGIAPAFLMSCTATASLVGFQKPLLSKYDSQLLCAVYYGAGTCFAVSVYIIIVALPSIAMIDSIVDFQFSDFYFDGSYVIWGCLGYGCVITTLFVYNAYTYASGLVAPSIVTIYSTILPAWTAIISFFVFNKPLSKAEALGGVMIALGLVLSVRGGMTDQIKRIKSARTLPTMQDPMRFKN